MRKIFNISTHIQKSLPLREGVRVGFLACACALVVGMMFTACQKDEETPAVEALKPIAFSSECAEEVLTRTAYPLYNYKTDMKLRGTKTVNSTASIVFPNYWLEYLTTSKSWQYISGQQNTVAGQVEKYWDTNATEYRFIAGAPYDKTTINDDTNLTSLTIHELVAPQRSTETVSTLMLFSEPKQVLPANFENSVMLTFHLAICRIKLQFYFEQAQTEDVSVTGVTFGPSTGGSYATKANMAITYDWTKIATPDKAYTQTVTASTTSSSALIYENFDIKQPGTTPKEVTEIYYMIPLSSTATASPWTLTIGGFTEHNTAEVPAEYMKWESGHQYIYVFKLSSAKVDPRIKFVTCVKSAITGWQDASESNADLYNW